MQTSRSVLSNSYAKKLHNYNQISKLCSRIRGLVITPGDKLWRELWSYRSVSRVLEVLKRLKQMKRQQLLVGKHMYYAPNSALTKKGMEKLTRHHLVPQSRGGGNEIGNQVYLKWRFHQLWHMWVGLATLGEVIDLLQKHVDLQKK